MQLDARGLAEHLAERISALAPQLLRNGNFSQGRRHWRCGSVQGEPGQSLCIWLDGPRRGRWKDFSSGESGDALDFVAAVICHGDLGEACRWSRDWLGLDALTSEEGRRLKEAAERARVVRQREAEREAANNAVDARRLWLAAAPLQLGNPGFSYLVDTRLIDLVALPAMPAALRVHPGLYNAESHRSWPALVAAISAPDGKHINTHRIWLARRPDGSYGKAPVTRPKLSMRGGYAGGCVRLWRGASGKPWNAMPEDETVLAGEGIEDVLTIVPARPEWRAIAVLSVSSLIGLVLPPQVTRLIWIAQNDPPGSAAAAALARALQEHRSRGLTVATIRPPGTVKDVNEWAQHLAVEDHACAA